MNYNKVIVAGRLTRDVELRQVSSGTVGSTSIAVNSNPKDKDQVDFFDVTFWNKTAEIVAQYKGKGDVILVEGSLRQERWEDKDGNKRSKVGINAQNVQFVGQGNNQPHVGSAKPDRGTGIDESEVPF